MIELPKGGSSAEPPPCGHKYFHQGLVFQHRDKVDGGRAVGREITYYHLYVCSRCMDTQFKNTDYVHDALVEVMPGDFRPAKIRFNATPCPHED